jgi:hypothetical protein
MAMTNRTTKTPPAEGRAETRPTTDPVIPDVQAGGGAGTPPGTRRRVWIALILAVTALAAVVAVATTAGQQAPPSETGADAVSTPAVGSEEFLRSLANQGYIPQQAVDQDRLLLERLVERGDVPAAALNDSGGATTLLYTPGEMRMIEAVASGQVPREALGADLLERLAADGGVTRAAAR